MKIIIDAYQHSSSITGTDRMAYNYLLHLQNIDHTNEYYIVCSLNNFVQGVLHAPNFKIIQPRFNLPGGFLRRAYTFIWRRIIAKSLLRLDADTYLSFHNMQLPKRRVAKKMITSNLDLIPVVLDDYKNLGRVSYREQFAEFHRVASLADVIISISDFSKAELCEKLTVPENKVKVIHLAADPLFHYVHDSGDQLTKLGIKDNYIFTIGGTEPRKNVKTVVDAFLRLPDEIRASLKLVIAGGEWHGRNLESLQRDPNIVTLGFVPDDLLPVLYKNARVFVFASEYEGFGFALLEAMSSGSPVISATGTSLDEVAEDAALKVDPHDTKRLAKQIQRVLTEKKLREKLIKAGHKQVNKFSWKVSAKKLHEVLTEPSSSPE